jgi:hypothetical protein
MKTTKSYISAAALLGFLSAIMLFCASAQSASATEYVVRSDGAVSTLNGQVTLTYTLPGRVGIVKATVPAGYTFDSSSGLVVPTTPAHLQSIIAHIDVAKHTTENFKLARGAKVAVKT